MTGHHYSPAMGSLETDLRDRLRSAFAAVAGDDAEPALRRSKVADYQADGALALSGRLARTPLAIAEEVVATADLSTLCEAVEVASPGFINLTIADDALSARATAALDDPRLGVEPTPTPEHIIVDYSAPNVAKEMHVGHLRSTVIGDALVRLLSWLGHDVRRENHIGDWGTPFGMLIEHLVDLGETDGAGERTAAELTAFYQVASTRFAEDPDFARRARDRVVLLQNGDAETRELWSRLVASSMVYFGEVYRRLDVRLASDDVAGESSYHDDLPATVSELDGRGMLSDSDGALCIFPDGFTNRHGEPLPLIVQKHDGGFGYASTDLATIRQRFGELGADRVLYVVGLPQRQHLEMVFAAARQAGWLVEGRGQEAIHVGFGSVLGPDRRLLRSRSGVAVTLTDLLDEAVRRAAAAVAAKSPDLSLAEQEAVATQVGIGAVKYADLMNERHKDYVFDEDRMVAFEGATAPYIQYAHARIHAIFRRRGVDPEAHTGPITIVHRRERELALELLAFPDVVATAADSFELHPLCRHLYDVAVAFSSFYDECPVLTADSEVRGARLALCRLTARTLAQGLDLLGIAAPDRM